MPARIAIISDLHIGDAARAYDLRPKGTPNERDVSYIHEFKRFVSENGHKADYLFVPGDITNRADPDEFKHATKIILDIACTLGVAPEHVFAVPGNHDVNWPVMTLGAFWHAQRYAPADVLTEALPTLKAPIYGSLLKEPYFSVWYDDRLLVVGLNSALRDGPDKAPHHGQVLNEQLRLFNNWLRDNPTHKDKYKILLTHHHPFQYSDPIPDLPDFSIMVNSENLLRTLHQHEFDFVIHGHKHVPRFQIYSPDMTTPVVMICAGSFCVTLDVNFGGVVANQFHILDIEGRDNKTRHSYGTLRSWTFLTGHSWRESSTHQGIHHVSPFGRYTNISDLADEIRSCFVQEITQQGWVSWTDLTKRIPTLKYVQLTVVLRVLERLRSDVQFKVHGDSLDALVILKERSNVST